MGTKNLKNCYIKNNCIKEPSNCKCSSKKRLEFVSTPEDSCIVYRLINNYHIYLGKVEKNLFYPNRSGKTITMDEFEEILNRFSINK